MGRRCALARAPACLTVPGRAGQLLTEKGDRSLFPGFFGLPPFGRLAVSSDRHKLDPRLTASPGEPRRAFGNQTKIAIAIAAQAISGGDCLDRSQHSSGPGLSQIQLLPFVTGDVETAERHFRFGTRQGGRGTKGKNSGISGCP